MRRTLYGRLLGSAVAAGVLAVSLVSARADAASDSWSNATSNLANMPSECGNLTMLSAVPDSNTVIAGVAQKGLWATADGGASWQPLGTGEGSAVITNRPSWISYDPLNAAFFVESGIYNGGGAYRTTDGGKTFVRLGSLTHSDFISVDYADPDRKTLLVGGHEQSRTVWKSADAGKTWANIGLNLPMNTGFSTTPVVLDAQTYLVNSDKSWSQGEPGIFRTTDGGTTWARVSSFGPSHAPLFASDGSIYWSVGDGLARSTDRGVTWSRVGSGLLGEFHPIEVPDGHILAARSDALVASADQGATWQQIGPKLPFVPAGVTYSANQTVFIWHWDCGTRVLPDAIETLAYDFGPAVVLPAPTPAPAPAPEDEVPPAAPDDPGGE